MNYKKTTITFTPFHDWMRDILVSRLGEIGYDSFVETETGFEAFIPDQLYNEKGLNEVISAFPDYQFEKEVTFIPDQNWNEEWEKKYFKPLVIGEDCMIRAPFHTDYPSAKYEIVIEPNMAFGTGNHETTSTIIESILKQDLKGKTVLDMGCGTGILGILASMKGAAHITAIDIDKWSYEGSLTNADLNGIKNMDVHLGDAALLKDQKFDVIFANIHKNILLEDMPAYNKVLNTGGSLIMSGFYRDDIPAISSRAHELGLEDDGYVEKNAWVACTYRKL